MRGEYTPFFRKRPAPPVSPPLICTEPTGFIIAIGSDPASYEGSQLSLPPADNQSYKGDDGASREGSIGTDGGVGGDDDLSLKTPPPLPALPSLPPADQHWYKSGDDSKGSEDMEICSVEGGMQNDFYSDEGDSDGSSSEEGLNESGKCHIHPHNTTCKYIHT